MRVFNFREEYPGLAEIFTKPDEERRSGGLDALWSFYGTKIQKCDALSLFKGGRVVTDLMGLKKEAFRIVGLQDHGIPCIPILPCIGVETLADILDCSFDEGNRDEIFKVFSDRIVAPHHPYLLAGVEVSWSLDQEGALSPEHKRKSLVKEEKTGLTFLEGAWLSFFFREILDSGFMDFSESITKDGQIPHLFKFNDRLILGKAPADRANFLWGLPTCRMRLTG